MERGFGFRLRSRAILLLALAGALMSLFGASAATPARTSTFSLHRLSFAVVRDGYFENDGISVFRWRATICTTERARVRVRTSVTDEDGVTVRFRWVIHKHPGCGRRRFTGRTGKPLGPGWIRTRLKAAWGSRVRYTGFKMVTVGGPS